MWMSEEDIAEMYRRSADPGKQVKILAELNATSREAIVEILTKAGVYEDVEPKRRTGRMPCVSEHTLEQYAARGYTMKQTAACLRVPYNTVQSRAWALGIAFVKEKQRGKKLAEAAK
jgi:hypothetical protein